MFCQHFKQFNLCNLNVMLFLLLVFILFVFVSLNLLCLSILRYLHEYLYIIAVMFVKLSEL